MIPVKIQCGCGQKYAFDVEPVNGRMATTVTCPICGADGTAAANEIIAQTLAAQPAPPPVPAPGTRIAIAPAGGARLAITPSAIAPAAAPRSAMSPPPLPAAQAAPKDAREFSLGMGILGAVVGAAVGGGAMYGFFQATGFRFPLLGIGIGLLTGWGARMLGRGTENTLGIISGGLALASVVGTLFLIYGDFPMLNIISVAVSVSVAYRTASG